MASVLTVGELAVELDARTKEFSRRMTGAEKRVQRFETQTTKSTKKAAGAFRSMLGPIAAIGTALAGIQVTRGLLNLAKSAVANAAAFESYEVRLKALLGSQEGANKALDSFLKLSSKTPFALTQIVGGATTLATVAGKSRKELDELTKVTANLAAVTGLGFQEAAGNLQRALAAGIGAADLFRDRGVRKMIEDVNNIPDLTKVSLIELRELFKKTFEPGALSGFGDAAVQLSQTLGGSLSNIGDAIDRFKIALGTALSPAVVGVAQGVIIPFFDRLTGKISESEDELSEFFIEGFAKGAESIAKFIGALEPLFKAMKRVVTKTRELSDEMISAFGRVTILFLSIQNGLNVLGTGLNAIGAALRVVSFMIGKRTVEEVDEQMAALDASALRTERSSNLLQFAIENLGTTGPPAINDNTEAMGEFEQAGLDAAAAIRKIGAEQIELRRKRRAAEDEPPPKPPGEGVVDRAALKARAQLRENEEAVADAEARLEGILAGGFQIPDESLEGFAEDFSFAITDGISTALDDILAGEGVDWAETFANMTGQFFEDTMNDVLSDIQGSFAQLFKNLGSQLSGLFGGEGGGLNLGAAFGAAVGLGGKIVSGALRGTSSNVRNELVSSVVTSTQEVRGLVAGPSNIPIAQVGDAIRDSFSGQLTELKRSNTLLNSILQAIRGLDLSAADTSEAVAEAIAAEFNGSVALG